MLSFEKQEQSETGFDYVAAADLARQKIEFENSSEEDLGTDEYKKIKSQLKRQIKAYGNIDVNDPDKTPAQRKIFELEVERQRLIIAKRKGEQPEVANTRPIEYDSESQMFIFEAKGGYQAKRTAGDLISDIGWGMYYDIKALENQPELAEFINIYNAKIFDAHLDEIEEEQLLIERIEINKIPKNNQGKGIGNAYLKTYETLKKIKVLRAAGKSYTEMPSGFVFERMINCLLTKVAFDLGVKWNFDISNATADDDIVNKIDVILELVNKRRGIGIEKNPTESELKKGYQVTLITSGTSEFIKKQNQVRKQQEDFQHDKALGKKTPVDDLILINPGEEIEDVASTLKIWQRQGMVAGGPEVFLSIERTIGKYLRDIFHGTKLDFDKNPEFLEEVKKIFKEKGMKERD
ncbi:MAG: hypothetical protein NTZ49_02280 [Candidatus Parcubacteria bacterium]|nr:hypothetical protein [Candidatus Parcubacteria bacterium]